jgi:hypothetical protein
LFQHPLRHERRLLPRIVADHQGRFHPRFARRRQLLGELVHVGSDRRIGYGQDLGRAAVVGLDFVNFRPGIAFWKLQDVLEVCPTPRIDALGVIPHHHHILVPGRQQINDLALETVRVLILIHQDELKAPLVVLLDIGMVLEKLQPKDQQVIEVHGVGGPFAAGVGGTRLLDDFT